MSLRPALGTVRKRKGAGTEHGPDPGAAATEAVALGGERPAWEWAVAKRWPEDGPTGPRQSPQDPPPGV